MKNKGCYLIDLSPDARCLIVIASFRSGSSAHLNLVSTFLILGPTFCRISSNIRGSILIQPFPKLPVLHSSKLKDFPDDNFKFDEYSRKFSKRVENHVGKGEIACNEQVLLFPQCFQKTCTADMGLVWKRASSQAKDTKVAHT